MDKNDPTCRCWNIALWCFHCGFHPGRTSAANVGIAWEKEGGENRCVKVTVQVGSIFQTSMTMEDILQVEVIQQQTMFFFHCWNFLECSWDRHFWTWERWFWSLVKLKHPHLTHGSASTNQQTFSGRPPPTCKVEIRVVCHWKPTVSRNSMLTVYMQDPFIYL